MVFLDGREGIGYAASADGQQGTAPVTIVEGARGGYYGSVQLLLDGERAALLHSDAKGGWWRRGTLLPAPFRRRYARLVPALHETPPLHLVTASPI